MEERKEKAMNLYMMMTRVGSKYVLRNNVLTNEELTVNEMDVIVSCKVTRAACTCHTLASLQGT